MFHYRLSPRGFAEGIFISFRAPSLGEFQYLPAVRAALIYAARHARPVFIHFLACLSPAENLDLRSRVVGENPPEKYLTAVARQQLFRRLLKTAVSIRTPLGFPRGELCRRKVWAYTQSWPRHTRTTLPPSPFSIASFRPFRSFFVSGALFRLTSATHPHALVLSLDRSQRTLPRSFSLPPFLSLRLSFAGALRPFPPPTIDVPRLSNHCARTDNSNGACYVLVGRRRRWWTHGRPTTTRTTAATSTSPRTSTQQTISETRRATKKI